MENQSSGQVNELFRFRFGDAEYDESRRELTVAGVAVDIEPRPLLVLGVLLRNVDQVQTRQSLVESAWGGRLTVANTLSNAILKLRKAIKDEQGERIVTLNRVGYKLVGPVTRISLGQQIHGMPELLPGAKVPGKPAFTLERQISLSLNSEVWLARGQTKGEEHIFKFCRLPEQLTVLKREVSLHRVLREALGERRDFVKMIDWNCVDPPYFLECEYAGVDLPTWSIQDEHLKQMALQERLNLFLQIADALAAAHQVGVIHKDLKPTNVLIAPRGDAAWQIRLADFGSGSLLKPERIKALGMSMLGLTVPNRVSPGITGTPLYLAPEVILGAAPTVQSDLYSLGLILYQIVIADLSRPIAPGWENDVEDELIRADIAAATDGQLSRRLSSVEALTDRLRRLDARRLEQQRFRELDLHVANAQRVIERAKARRPWVIGAIASLTLGLAVSLWMYQSQTRALQRAEFERARAQTLNNFLNDDLLSQLDLSAPGQHRIAMTEALLQRAQQKAQQVFTHDPLTLASVLQSIGQAYFGLSKYKEAAEDQRRAIDLFVEAAGESDDRTLGSRYAFARSLDMLGQHAQAAEQISLADLAAADRLRQPSVLAMLAHWTHAGNGMMQFKPAQALVEAELADQIRESLGFDDAMWLLRTKYDLAWCELRLQQSPQALKNINQLLSSYYSPELVGILDWSKIHLLYALALRNLNQSEEADRVIQEVIDQASIIVGHSHYLIGLAWSHRASIYAAQARWQDAINANQVAKEIFIKERGMQSVPVHSVESELIILEYLMTRSSAALPALAKNYENLKDGPADAEPFKQISAYYFADALLDSDQVDDAEEIIANLDPKVLAAGDAGNYWDAKVDELNARVLIARNKKDEGIKLLKMALASLQRQAAPPWMTISLAHKLEALEPKVARNTQ